MTSKTYRTYYNGLNIRYASRVHGEERNVTVWRLLSVCLSSRYTHGDSPGGSMRRGQRTYRIEPTIRSTDILVLSYVKRN